MGRGRGFGQGVRRGEAGDRGESEARRRGPGGEARAGGPGGARESAGSGDAETGECEAANERPAGGRGAETGDAEAAAVNAVYL